MKNLLLLLLLANILYFVWGFLAGEDPQPGTAVIPAVDAGASLTIIPARDGSDAAGADGVGSNFQPLSGPACATIGPLRDRAQADEAAGNYANRGMRTSVRSREEEIFVGHWVQIRNVPNDITADKMLTTLNRGGLKDAYLVRTDDEGMKISLGLFDELARAERVELKARSLELPADISPRMAERTVHYVDIGVPSGQGVAVIVEEFGEELVQLRGAATCPE